MTFVSLGSTSLPQIEVLLGLNAGPFTSPASVTWTDISTFVRGYKSKRGRQNQLGRFEAGTCNLLLDNRTRRFDPTFATGPYFGNLKLARWVQVNYKWGGVTFPRYTGFIERLTPRWGLDGKDSTVELVAGDYLKHLALYELDAAFARVNELTGARIDAILTALAVPATSKSIDAGNTALTAVTAGTHTNENALSYLQEVADAEGGGGLYARGDGVIKFENRQYRTVSEHNTRTTFGDGAGEVGYTQLEPDYDDEFLSNDVRVTPSSSTMQTATDATSKTDYGPRVLSKDLKLMASDAEALSLAQYLRDKYKSPDLRVPAVAVSDPAQWAQTLARDLSHHVTVIRRPPGGGAIVKELYVEGVEDSAAPGKCEVKFNLSPADLSTYWVLGTAQLGTDTRLAF